MATAQAQGKAILQGFRFFIVIGVTQKYVGAIHVALADRRVLPLPENKGFGYCLPKS